MNLENDINPDWDGTIKEPKNSAPMSRDAIIMTAHQYELMLQGQGPYGKYRDQLLGGKSK